MFEGSNIHYSADNKLLCSYSAKLCKLRRLTGYGFCCRHILEDPSAPFKQCTYVRNKYRCGIPVQQNKESDLCNKHEHKVKSAQETNVGTLLVPSPPDTPLLENGISPTPPSTPTHDPSKMSLMDRIKSKFTRVQNCSLEDMIVNVEDDVDPYAFPDTDPMPNSSPSSQTVKSPGAEFSGHFVTRESDCVALSSTSAVVPQSLCVSSTSSLGTGISVCTSLPPTPPSGETPIAKMYPELLGKLHASPTPMIDRSPCATISRTVSKAKCCAFVVAQKCPSAVSKPAQTAGKAQKSSNKTNTSGKGRKTGSGSESSKSGPQGGSIHSSRTMNKLQNKIAQNKIQDKIRSKAKQQKDAVTSQNAALSLVPGALPPIQTGLSSSVTSTIFSLGSIPSLGTFLSTQQQRTAGDQGEGQTGSKSVATPLALPVALPLITSQPLLSPNSSGNIPMVIPATVFTPFPNLAGALNNLHKKDKNALKPQNSPVISATPSKVKSRDTKVSKISKEGLKLTIKKSAVKSKKLKRAKTSLANQCTKNKGVESVDKKKTESVPVDSGMLATNVLQISSQDLKFNQQSKSSKSQVKSHLKSVSQTLKKRKKSSSKKVSRRPKTLPLKSYNTVSSAIHISTQHDVESQNTSQGGVFKSPSKDVKDYKVSAMKVDISKSDAPIELNKQSSCVSTMDANCEAGPTAVQTKSDKSKPRQVTMICPKLKRLNDCIMSEFEVKKKFRRKSAWDYYRIYADEKRKDTTLLPFGVESSSDDESTGLHSLQRDPLVFSDDEKITDKELYDSSLLSTIRTTQESVVKSKLRRRLSQIHTHNRLDRAYHCHHSRAINALVEVAKRSPSTASELVLATDNAANYKEHLKRKSDRIEGMEPGRKCLITDKESNKTCGKAALPYTNHCMKHIMYNVEQKLFDYCTAKFANNTQCCVSVFDVTHELPLCSEHARKADNYQRIQEERQVRKPRKKTKPSALTRPPKKGKKRKKVVQKSEIDEIIITKNNLMENCLDLPSSDTEKGEGLETNLAALPSQSDSQDEDIVQQTRVNNDVLTEIRDGLDSDMDEPFSPGMIEKNLDLPLDFEDATKLLDKHDLDMLNKMPDEAFDLFAAVSEKNEQLTPTKEETDMLEKAIAEASSSLNIQQHADLSAFTRDDLTKLSTMERVHSNPPADYMSDNEEKADELTKQIASSLMQSNPLSDDEDDLDNDSLNNLASSLTPNDLRSISQALIASDIDISLVANENNFGATSNQRNVNALHHQQGLRVQGQTEGHLNSFQGRTPTVHNQQQNQLPLAAQMSNYISGSQGRVLTEGHRGAVQGRNASIPEQILTVRDAQMPCQNQPSSTDNKTVSNASSQLSQLLNLSSAAASESGTSTNSLQENIRMFLNATSTNQTLQQLNRTSTQETGNINTSIPHSTPNSTPYSILHDFLTQAKTNHSSLPAAGAADNNISSQSQTMLNARTSLQQPVTTSHTEVNLEQLNKQLQLQPHSSQTTVNQSLLNAINASNGPHSTTNANSDATHSFVFSLPDCRTPGVPNVSLKPGSRSQPIPGIHNVTLSPKTSDPTCARLNVSTTLASQNVASILSGSPSQFSLTSAKPPFSSVSCIRNSEPSILLTQTTTTFTSVVPNVLTKSNPVSPATALTNQNAASIPAPIMSCRPSENRTKTPGMENKQQILAQLLPNLKSNMQTTSSQPQFSVVSTTHTNTHAPGLAASGLNSVVEPVANTQLMGSIIDAMRCQLPPNAVVSNVPPKTLQVAPVEANKTGLQSNGLYVQTNSQQLNNVQGLQRKINLTTSQPHTNILNSDTVLQHNRLAPSNPSNNLTNAKILPQQTEHSNINNVLTKEKPDSVSAVSVGQPQKGSKNTEGVKTKAKRRSQSKNTVIMQSNISQQIHSNKVISVPSNQTVQPQLHSNAITPQVLPINANLQHIMPKQSGSNQPVAIATSLPGVATLAKLPNGLQQALLAALQAQSQQGAYPIQTVQIPPGFQVLANNSVHPATVTVASQPLATQPFLAIATMQAPQQPSAVKLNKNESVSQ